MYFIKTPNITRLILPNLICRVPGDDKSLYLTFDDGPTPKITSWVLDELKEYSAKATFFCLGKNIENNYNLFSRVISEGHGVGNHSFSHLNGMKTNNNVYFDDVEKANSLISTHLFRPPYGLLKFSQFKALKEVYKVVLWDVMPGDFDIKISNEKCLQNIFNHATEGSIIVMHDTFKSEEKLRYALPEILKYYTNEGFSFRSIDL